MNVESESQNSLIYVKHFVKLNQDHFEDTKKCEITELADFLDEQIERILRKLEKVEKLCLSRLSFGTMKQHTFKSTKIDNSYEVLRLLIWCLDEASEKHDYDRIFYRLVKKLNKKYGDRTVSLKVSEVINLIYQSKDADYDDFTFGETIEFISKSLTNK